ncbi:MAG: efflux RND transporter permease subunit [Acidobacteriota bacterium]
MLSRFFLDRPVFAWVIAIVMMAAGVMAIFNMPVSQYPNIAPPSIYIIAIYPGGSAETVEATVTQIIEQKLTGLDNLLYVSATSDSSGLARLELTFAPGTDPDLAWAKVQNKLQLALPSLPEAVTRTGITVGKATRNFLLIVGLVSEDGRLTREDLMDYAFSNLEKVIARLPGVGEVEIFGSQYAMRVWLDPDKLTNYALTVADVVAALRAYNVEVSAGQFGGEPAPPGQRLNASIIVQHLLRTPEEFAAIPVRVNRDGSVVRVRDVARTELGTEFYDVNVLHNGRPASGLAIRMMAGANALETANRVKQTLEEMSVYFPPGMKVVYPFDTTPFTVASIREVVRTLIEAIILVFLIMYLFLGTVRATLVPTIAVPVVLLGTFGILWLAGYSINVLDMFALILAIGLLVDDAIVVVENVERIMAEEGLSPKEATAKSMDQITSALIGIGLVLSAVFGPMAFFGGSTGILYRQFSITIISSMMLSVLVALILTPVLCASLLRPIPAGHQLADTAVPFLRPFFRWFEHVFFRGRGQYVRFVERTINRKFRYLLLYAAIVAVLGFLFLRMPTAYLPDEDQGSLLVQVVLPSGSALEQTEQVLKEIQDYFDQEESESVESFLSIAGFSFAGRGQNVGMGFLKLKDWDLRDDESSVWAVQRRAMARFARFREAMAFVFIPPAITELGTSTGFDFQLLDFGGVGHQQLMAARNQLLGMAARDPRLIRVRPNGLDDVPQYQVDIDWEKAGALGVPITAVHQTIAASFGSAYVNDFIQSGRVKRVYVQADSPFRMKPMDLERLYVRNTQGKMVPFSSLASGRWIYGSPKLERFNGFPSINIQGEAAPGYSTGDAMSAMEELVRRLPAGMGFGWTGVSYQERLATGQAPVLYAFSVFVIFLCLAALYESWPIPIAVLVCFPLGLVGGVAASTLRGLPNDVYFQIALLTTMGLTAKNAILIVQFAKSGVERGMGLVEATLEGARLRFRPIVMTTLAFGFGVLPLVLASGAGAGAQKAIGTGVFGGMAASTTLVIMFAPLFYLLIQRWLGKKPPVPPRADEAPAEGEEERGHE